MKNKNKKKTWPKASWKKWLKYITVLLPTGSVSQRRQCHSWSTRCWVAGLRSWHSWVFSAFHTPGRVWPGPSAWTWHQACTSWQIPHRNTSPVPRQSPFLPALDHKLWRGSKGRWGRGKGCYEEWHPVALFVAKRKEKLEHVIIFYTPWVSPYWRHTLMFGIQNGRGPRTQHFWLSPQEQGDPACKFHRPKQLQGKL